jgi:hypothetical protein
MDIGLQVDCDSQSYKISVDGDWKEESVSFNENVESVERLVFRTGSWRSDVRSWILEGEPANRGLYMEDLPGADDPISANLVFLDDVEARSLTRREK